MRKQNVMSSKFEQTRYLLFDEFPNDSLLHKETNEDKTAM